MNSQFNSALYDEILGFIVENAPLGEIADFGSNEETPFYSPEGVSFDAMKSILKYFEAKHLVERLDTGGNGFSHYFISFSLRAEGIQFHNLGGFTLEEHLLVQAFERLQIELDALKPSAGDRVARITSIMGHISHLIKTIPAIQGIIGLR